jgi:hypothetical protein
MVSQHRFHIFQLFSKLYLVALLLLGMPLCVQAQEDPLIRDIIEQLGPELGEDFDLSELVENLSYYQRKPIDLNRTSMEQLKSLFFLSPLQISNLLNYRSTNSKFSNVLELQGVDGFDVLTLQRLLPFVRVGAAADIKTIFSKELFKAADQEIFLRVGQTLEKQRGFEDLPGSKYLGSREKLLGKYKYRYRDLIAANLVLEKDAGEHLFSGPNRRSMDFASGNVTLSNLGRFKKVVVGDYNLQFGQGLTMWSGFGYGKGPDVTSVAKKDLGVRPYSSANEISFLRGAAVSFGITDQLLLTAYGSTRNIDASTKTAEDGTVTQVNMSSSGLHRTPTEIRNKNTLGQQVFGGAVQYLSDNLNAGIVAYNSNYSNAFVTGPLAYNHHNFSGKNLTNLGVHYNYTFLSIYFYGEVAHNLKGGIAMVNGAMASLSKTVSAVLVNRSYDVNHHSFFTRSLGETADASNEKGWYAGVNVTPNKKITFALYGDIFQFPWLKYRIDLPSKGYEVLAQAVYTPSKSIKAVLRLKTEQKQQNPDEQTDSTYIVNVGKTNYRVALTWQLNRSLSLEHRTEFVQYWKESVADIGFLIYQDVALHPMGKKLSGNARIAYFKTDSYNSRVYAYEDDVLYSSGFGMYNGRGFRAYLNLRYKVTRKLDLWARHAVFIYQNVETVGSGLDLIQGNKKNELKFQMRYQF